MVHLYNRILVSHKKEWNWEICRDIDEPRETFIQSEVCLFVDSRDMVQMNIYAKQKYRHRQREHICEHQGGKGSMGWIEKLGLTHIYYYL